MIDFEVFLKDGSVRKTQRDQNKARSLMNMAKQRLEFSKSVDIPNFKLEFSYEAVIEAIESVMALDGFKSYSHVADISYLQRLRISKTLIVKLDSLRFLRHKSKYYGEAIGERAAKDAVEFATILIAKLDEVFSSKI